MNKSRFEELKAQSEEASANLRESIDRLKKHTEQIKKEMELPSPKSGIVMSFIKTSEFMVGAFVAFVLTTIMFTFILTQGFVAKEFLRQNNIYLDGKYYKLCKRQN